MSRWGAEGPPEEAYSRVTDPERFLPLHEAAQALVARLEREYTVLREEGYALEAPLPGVEFVRPSIRLAPFRPASAPILVSFLSFPSVLLRFGHCASEVFPSCGCDACDESVEEEAARLENVVGGVVTGRFHEAARRMPWGRVTVRWVLWSENGRSSGGAVGRCAEPLPWWRLRRATEWKPWPRRSPGAAR